MKTTLLTLLFFIGFGATTFAQVNQYNAAKQKNGKWIVYWDRNWKEVKDSAKARYFRYNEYINGKDVYPMGPCGRKGWRLEGDTTAKLLDGRYNWYTDKGVLSSSHLFKKGEYLDCKEYYLDGKTVKQHFAYGQKYRDWPNTWVLYMYDKDGKAKYFAFYNDKTAGWSLQEVTEADTKRVN